MPRLLSKILNSLARDRDIPLSARLFKGARYVVAMMAAPYRLRRADTRGRRVRIIGTPVVQNDGRLEIGDDLVLNAYYAPVELTVAEGGRISIGSGVVINFGCALTAARSISVGDGASLGPFCTLMDHEPGLEGDAKPIVIAPRAWLAGRVTVMPGCRIGEGAVVAAGSIVTEDIPDFVIAAGIPAQVRRAIPRPAGAGGTASGPDARPA